MTTVTTKAVAKVAAVATGLAMATSMLSLAPMAHAAALTSAQISSIISLLQSFGADSTTIANVQASLTGGTPTGGSTGGSTSSSCSFARSLTVGSTGSDVTCLQNALKAGGYMTVNATGYFGPATKAAVVAWQKAAGVSPASGYFGPLSRAAFGGSSSGGNGGVVVGTGTGLKVLLASDSPNGSVLVQGQGIGRLAKFDFTNPTSAPITVTALTFKRIGVSNDTALTNVYLYNSGTRITDSAGVSASQFSFSNPNGIFMVPAGGVYTVTVRSDIASTNTSGQQIGVQLVAVSASTALDGSVSLPISSGYQTVSAATLAGVDFNGTVTPTGSPSISPQNDYPVWQQNVNVSTNPVKLSSMRFTNLGSINATDISNFRLYIDGNMVGSAVSSLAADRSITFDLSASPVTLSQQGHVVKVLANITAGAGRTVQMSVQRTADTMFVDAQLGQPVTPTAGGVAFTAQTTSAITINSVSSTSGVSVSLASGSPTQNVAVGATNVKWGSFSLLASGENVKVQDLFVYASSTTSGGALAGVGGLQNGKIMVNGVQVGSTKNIGSLSANKTDFSLGSSLILPAGQTTQVDIYGDAKDTGGTNLPPNSTVLVALASATANGQGQSSLNSVNIPNADVKSNTLTVVSTSLTANKYSGYGNQTMIAGTNNAKIGAFTLSAGSTEGVNVNTIVVTFPNAVSSTITNLTLKDDSTGSTLGSVQTTPSISNSFAVNVPVTAGGTKTVDIYANILSGANAGTIVPSVDQTTSGTGAVTGISASPGTTPLQTITLATSGTLTVSRGAGDPVSNNVLAGASSVKVGQFNFAAQKTSYTVSNLLVLIPANAATSVTNVTVSYKDVNGATQTATQALTLPTGTLASATATFTGLTMYVPQNDSANLDVYVGTPTIASGATSGAAINVTLDDGHGSNTFLATDAAGNTLTTFTGGNTASNGTFYVRKSIPTLAMVTLNNTVPVSGAPLYKFTVTADPAGAIEWSKVVFNVSTSSSPSVTLTGAYLADDATGQQIVDNISTSVPAANSASTTATAITIDLTKNATQPQYQQVAAGATKTYDLYGTVTGFGSTGSTLTLSLAADTGSAPAVNAAAGSVSGNIVWSDRSGVSGVHTPPSPGVAGTTDFTNGYLLKNLTSTAVSYSK